MIDSTYDRSRPGGDITGRVNHDYLRQVASPTLRIVKSGSPPTHGAIQANQP
jgi:hypothetical protein